MNNYAVSSAKSQGFILYSPFGLVSCAACSQPSPTGLKGVTGELTFLYFPVCLFLVKKSTRKLFLCLPPTVWKCHCKAGLKTFLLLHWPDSIQVDDYINELTSAGALAF